MRKIALIIPNLQKGGAESALLALANQWVETDNIYIITMDEGGSFFNVDPRIKLCPLHTTKKLGFFGPLYNGIRRFWMLPKTILKINPDVTIPYMDTSIVWTFFSRVFTKKPLIMVFQVTPSKAILRWPLRGFPKLFYKSADAVVVLTQNTFDIFDRLKIKMPVRRYVIPNPVRPDIVSETSYQKEDIILGVGRLVYQKQFDLLIKMYAKLQPTHWRLWIVGGGPKQTELEHLITELKLNDKVTLFGARKDVSNFYGKAKIFTLPSLHEGFPVALCEALSNGCGAISFDCETGPSDIINHNVNGLLIEDQNIEMFIAGLRELMNDAQKLNYLAFNARKITDRLNPRKILEQYERVVDDVRKSE